MTPSTPMVGDLQLDTRFFATEDGWELSVKRTVAPKRLNPDLRPLLIVPGYGMNAFIFGYHPRGTSMEKTFAEYGFEVWSVNLRMQGESRRIVVDAAEPSLWRYAQMDLQAVLRGVLRHTQTSADRVDVLGASLGGSVVYAHLALSESSPVGAVVAVGAPLSWVNVHPLLRFAFGSPRVAGLVRVKGARLLAERVLPLAARAPWLLSLYMNADIVDLTGARELVRTVEDPCPRVNRDIARWVRDRDMVLRGVNVTRAMKQQRRPLMLVVGNRDGIVPSPVALSAQEAWGDREAVTVLRVGDEHIWYAHADLFVSDPAPQTVFAPIATWLKQQHV